MDNIIETLRREAVCDVFSPKMAEMWRKWYPHIYQLRPSPLEPSKILDLGDHLSEIFKITTTKERSQGAVSKAGTAWENLVLWYTNLCCAGTRVVIIKKKTQVPEPFRNAVTVTYGNLGCNTESDLTVLVFPDRDIYTQNNPDFLKKNGKVDYKKLNTAISGHFREFELGIIQCKTNWNENSQVPMLWDMIYHAGGFRQRNIKVGANNFHIKNLEKFTYAFVTVPTVKLTIIKPGTVRVKRVCNLSGGNFWGRPTTNGIAGSLKEIFGNYDSGFTPHGIRHKIDQAIPEYSPEGKYNYFWNATQ